MNHAVGRHFISTITFLFLTLMFPLYLYMESNVKYLDFNIALSWFIIVYVGFQISKLMIKSRERMLEMTFWIFAYVFMGIAPFIQLCGKQFPWSGNYSSYEITMGLFVVIIGIVSYQVGLIISNKKQLLNYTPEREISFSTNSFMILSLIIIIVSVGIILTGDGLHSLFSPRNADIGNQQDIKSISLIKDQFIKTPIFVCLILGILMWKNKKMNQVRGKIMVIVLLFLNLIISNPISSARLWVGSVILTIIILIIPWKNMGISRWTYSFLSILLIIFPYADIFRDSLNNSLKIQKMTDIIMFKGDYDAFQMILNTLKFVDIFGLSPGKQLMSTLFFWIPRNIWIDKPYSSGQEIAASLGYKFTNLSCPLWAESYVNFGYLGIIIIFILFGIVTNILQRRYINSRHGSFITMSQILVPFLTPYQIFFLRGDLQNAFTYLSGFLFIVILFNLNSKVISPHIKQRQFMHTMYPAINQKSAYEMRGS